MNNESLKIFIKGVDQFNLKNYYDSHEYFEDIWINHHLDNRLFVQGLIQLSVAYFHISNDNKNGAMSLFKKSIKKLNNNNNNLISNINNVVDSAYKSFNYLQSIDSMHEFDWTLAPKLKLSNSISK